MSPVQVFMTGAAVSLHFPSDNVLHQYKFFSPLGIRKQVSHGSEHFVRAMMPFLCSPPPLSFFSPRYISPSLYLEGIGRDVSQATQSTIEVFVPIIEWL